jgi:penicillin-binding protein-related factor A (putative recombinase)
MNRIAAMDMNQTTQDRLTGERFEGIVTERCVQLRMLGLASIGKYGVQSRLVGGEWMPVQSLPDFEGVTMGGRQLIFDCKVCSQASFPLEKYRKLTGGSRAKQLTHMIERSHFGVRCFFLIHWNPRELKTRREPAVTYAFPVAHDHPFWVAFERGEVKSLDRHDCETYAQPVPWNLAGTSDRKPRPDVLAAVKCEGVEISVSGV